MIQLLEERVWTSGFSGLAGWLTKTPRSRFSEKRRKFVSHPSNSLAVCGLRKEKLGGPIQGPEGKFSGPGTLDRNRGELFRSSV